VWIGEVYDMDATEAQGIQDEPFLLDGPVGRRVAVLDFDENGDLVRGARFRKPRTDREVGRFRIRNPDDRLSRELNQVSVFATVLRTLRMFEEEDTLGREVAWAFDGPQLLVVPRAGEWANAFYERDSHSLQFFFFTSRTSDREGRRIFTSLSPDIVAHETAHAILDGIAPDLYHAITPQSLALHEAIADLTAAVMAFRSPELRETVLRQTNGSIENPSAFSWLAEEFAHAQDPSGRTGYLRTLLNDKTLDPEDRTTDSCGEPNRVCRSQPHALSQVLSGAIYRLAVRMHEQTTGSMMEDTGESELSVAGAALAAVTRRIQRTIFRALDYLPPGEITFADFARAVVASDRASHPGPSEERDWLLDEFKRRAMVDRDCTLDVPADFDHAAVRDLDPKTLVEHDWVAYEFADQNRELLGIPERTHFRVGPRLDVLKSRDGDGGREVFRECIYKVSWDRKEPNRPGARLPIERQLTVGTTMVVDWETHRVRALITSDAAAGSAADEQQRRDRDAILHRLAAAGTLRFAGDCGSPHGARPLNGVRVERTGRLMRVRRSATLLHLASETSGESDG